MELFPNYYGEGDEVVEEEDDVDDMPWNGLKDSDVIEVAEDEDLEQTSRLFPSLADVGMGGHVLPEGDGVMGEAEENSVPCNDLEDMEVAEEDGEDYLSSDDEFYATFYEPENAGDISDNEGMY